MMTDPATPLSASPEHRAQTVSILGLLLQVALCAFLGVIALWNHSLALQAEARFAAAGLGVWFALMLVSHQRKLVRAEALEAAELKRQRESAGAGGEAIFEVDEEQLMLARRRLSLMVKWFVPVVTLLLASYYFGAAVFYWPVAFAEPLESEKWPAIENASVSAAFLIGAAFVTFLFSRYASGMARREEWRELRAGASNLFGNSLLCAALAVMLGLAHFQYPLPERVAAIVIRVLLVLLGLELLLNLLVDVYRPRTAGAIDRPAFDSRFLGLFSESGGIARSIAEAINYQFGFEVSSTWFYQLMYRATVPLIAFGILCVIAVSSLVVVQPHERAVVERFGVRLQDTEPLEPGLYFKWPWPIERAYKFPVSRIQLTTLGAAEEESARRAEEKEVKTVLWTTTDHGAAQDNYVLVAIPPSEQRSLSVYEPDSGSAGSRSAGSVPVSILRAMARIQYRVRDLYAYGYGYANPERLLRGIAERELIRYTATVDVNRIMGPQRAEAARVLQEEIQARVDEMGMGVEIVFVGLQDFHPDKSVASAFQQVVGAIQQSEAAEEEAKGKAIEMLAEVAGDADLALALDEAIRRVGDLQRSEPADSPVLREAVQLRDALFASAAGQVSEILARARSYRWERENLWLSRAERFTNELLAYRAAPSVYTYRRYLLALSEGLARVRKFLVATSEAGPSLIMILNRQEEQKFRALTR